MITDCEDWSSGTRFGLPRDIKLIEGVQIRCDVSHVPLDNVILYIPIYQEILNEYWLISL